LNVEYEVRCLIQITSSEEAGHESSPPIGVTENTEPAQELGKDLTVRPSQTILGNT
jgi:hypothetical protein